MEHMTIHRMRRTDRLETLSAQYRVPVCMIMRANALADPQQLSHLRELKIPYRCFCNRCAQQQAAANAVYIVQPDDTLYGIARHTGLTMRILLKANAMEDPGDIRPGESLVIPRISGEIYTVREGENLDDIARRFGKAARRIQQANWLEQREDIYPGLLLLIPEI